jgi:hypothetical protein
MTTNPQIEGVKDALHRLFGIDRKTLDEAFAAAGRGPIAETAQQQSAPVSAPGGERSEP